MAMIKIRAIWHAIKMLDTASGDPFHYDVHAGYGHVTGELGVELDQLMSNQGDEVAGRSNLVKVCLSGLGDNNVSTISGC